MCKIVQDASMRNEEGKLWWNSQHISTQTFYAPKHHWSSVRTSAKTDQNDDDVDDDDDDDRDVVVGGGSGGFKNRWFPSQQCWVMQKCKYWKCQGTHHTCSILCIFVQSLPLPSSLSLSPSSHRINSRITKRIQLFSWSVYFRLWNISVVVARSLVRSSVPVLRKSRHVSEYVNRCHLFTLQFIIWLSIVFRNIGSSKIYRPIEQSIDFWSIAVIHLCYVYTVCSVRPFIIFILIVYSLSFSLSYWIVHFGWIASSTWRVVNFAHTHTHACRTHARHTCAQQAHSYNTEYIPKCRTVE